MDAIETGVILVGSDKLGDVHGDAHRADGDDALRDIRLAGVVNPWASPAADGGGDVVPIGDPQEDEGYGDEDDDDDEEDDEDDEES